MRNQTKTATAGKRTGRPRLEDASERSGDRYTPQELRQLWYSFRGDPDEIEKLMGFAVLEDRNAAIRLSQTFWQDYEREQKKQNKAARKPR